MGLWKDSVTKYASFQKDGVKSDIEFNDESVNVKKV